MRNFLDRREFPTLYKAMVFRVDDRLRVMQEVVKRRLLGSTEREEDLEIVAAFLSYKPLSKWLGKSFND